MPNPAWLSTKFAPASTLSSRASSSRSARLGSSLSPRPTWPLWWPWGLRSPTALGDVRPLSIASRASSPSLVAGSSPPELLSSFPSSSPRSIISEVLWPCSASSPSSLLRSSTTTAASRRSRHRAKMSTPSSAKWWPAATKRKCGTCFACTSPKPRCAFSMPHVPHSLGLPKA